MANQQLIDWIVNQKNQGFSSQQITDSLIQHGYNSNDFENAINDAFQTSQSSGSQKKSMRFLLITVIIVLIISSIGGGAYLFLSQEKRDESKEASKQKSITATSIPTIIPSVTPTSGDQQQLNEEETKVYSSTEQGYSFRYLKSWKIQSGGTLTALYESEIPENPLEAFLVADALVSTVPYAGIAGTVAPGVTIIALPEVKSHDDQVKDLAMQLPNNNEVEPININKLSGFSAPSRHEEGTTFNIFLKGETKMLLIQFPNKDSISSLTSGQMTILNSIEEL